MRCFWSDASDGPVIVVDGIIQPNDSNSVISGKWKITFQESYVAEVLSAAETSKHAIGLVHSHPIGCPALPSRIDDEMDNYFSELAGAIIPDAPYISFIVSKCSKGNIDFSGRVLLKGKWFLCRDLTIIDDGIVRVQGQNVPPTVLPKEIIARLERLADGLGKLSADRLWSSKVGIVGGGGTGSAAFHSAVRSCFGKIVVIDPQRIAKSNMERVHGIESSDILGDEFPFKVDALARFASRINPLLQVKSMSTDVLQSEANLELVDCDVILGCTDSEVGRLVVADLANRFLIPTFNVNVSLQGGLDGVVKSQYVHLTRYGPDLPCPYCRDQVDPRLLAQELMSNDERGRRQEMASRASEDQRQSYWQDEPVLPTVGSLTTIAAEFAVNAAIGLVTGAFKPLNQFLQFNLLRPELEAVALVLGVQGSCICRNRKGKADQVPSLTGSPSTSNNGPNVAEL